MLLPQDYEDCRMFGGIAAKILGRKKLPVRVESARGATDVRPL
jgi:hypothetical protein